MKKYGLSFCMVMAIFLYKLPLGMNSNNTIYLLEAINWYDKNSFAGNYAVHESWQTVRFMLDLVLSIGMYIFDGSWTTSAYIVIISSLCILALAVVRIAMITAPNYILVVSGILSIFIVFSVNAGFPGFTTFDVNTLSIGMGYAFAVLAISYAVEYKWNKAWMVLAISIFFHIHEGVWGGAFVLTLQIKELYEKKLSWMYIVKEKIGLIIYICSFIIVVFIGMNSDYNTVTSAQFVNIYANYRHPHHLIPSAWGWKVPMKFLLLPVFAIITQKIIVKNEGRNIDNSISLTLAIGAWLLAYVATFAFTEIIQIATVATMYIPKFFKYIGIWTYLWHVQTLCVLLDRRKTILFTYVFLTIIFASEVSFSLSIIAYVILFIVLKFHYHGYRDVFNVVPLLLVGVMIFYSHKRYEMFIVAMVFLIGGLLWYRYGEKIKQYWSYKLNVIFSLIFICLGICHQFLLVNKYHIEFFTPEKHLQISVGRDVYLLSIDLKKYIESNEVFFGDPRDENIAWLQLLGRRNTYVVYKVIPSSKKQVAEWYRRMTITDRLLDKKNIEIYDVLKKEGVRYLLLNKNIKNIEDDTHFQIIRQQGDYHLYKINY